MKSKLFASLLRPIRPPRARGSRRGGRRQRLENNEEVPEEEVRGTLGHLGPGMLLEFCDGWLSSYRLCQHMKHAVEDGATCRLVKAIGKIANVQNPYRWCNQGMAKLIASFSILATITPIANSCWTHYIKPTNLIRMIHENYPREFRLRFGADVIKLRAFWNMFFCSPVRRAWATTHTYLTGKGPSDLERTIPIVVHQDAGPISKTQSADVISFSSMLSDGPEKITKFLIATCIHTPSNDVQIWVGILQDLEIAAT